MGARALDRYRKQLLAKRRELLAPKLATPALVPTAGGWFGDFIDQANAEVEADIQISMHKTDGRLLRAIEEALARMRRGTFGVCEDCRQRIPRVRLEAVPWTRHCRDCKEQMHP